MDISVEISGIPFLTKWYLGSVFATAFTLSYLKAKYIGYLILDYSRVFKHYEIWRLITNIFVVGPFSTNFLFFLYFVFSTFRSYESAAIKMKRYAEFMAMIVYLLVIVHLVCLTSHYLFSFQVNATLCQPILFAMIYVDSKRNPLQPVMMFFFKTTNAYLPFAYVLLNVITGGNVFESVMGIIVGHVYYYLKDLLPLQKGWNVLPTPKFLVDFVEKHFGDNASAAGGSGPSNFSTLNNQNASGSFGNNNTGNAGGNNVFRRANNEGNRGFRAFSGTGHTLG